MKIRSEDKRLFSKFLEKNQKKASPGQHDIILVLDHLKPDFNVGKIFRSADAFGCCEVHLIGIDYFNVASSKGSFKHVPVKFYKNFDESYNQLMKDGYDIFLLEMEAKLYLGMEDLPQKTAFVVGHEQFGLSFNPKDYKGTCSIKISQVGKTQSLNVSVAASIAMYEYTRQHMKL